MVAAKAHNSSPHVAKAPARPKPAPSAAPAKAANPVWHNLATRVPTAGPAVVQTKCAACEAEEREDGSENVQLWDCSKYGEPTCVREPVQTKCAACEAEEQVQQAGKQARTPELIHREARRGLSGATSPLPHGEQIQTAFGHHDVSHVRTSIGGDAAAANQRMGAQAFTSGDRIGFRQAPSLRLAAHEAAHVVQQREGLSLPDNVGRAGDRWERHADRVADAVVEGRSAAPLLDEVAQPTEPAAEPAEVVQRQITSGASRLHEVAPVPAPPPVSRAPGAEAAAQQPEAAEEPARPPEEESVLEAAAAGDREPPPAGVPAEGTAPPPPQPVAAEAPTEVGTGAAPCYNVDPPPKPEDAKEPEQDNPSGESKAKPQVTFEPWPDEVDECPPKNAPKADERMPENIRASMPPADGTAGATAAPTTAPESSTAVAALGAGPAPAGREPQAAARAGEPPSDQPLGESSALDDQIAGGEAARDEAVGSYLAATAGLGDVLARCRGLETGVDIPPASAQGQASVAELRGFLARAASEIAAAVDFVREQVPGRLGGLAESLKAAIQGAIETEKSAVSDRIAQAGAAARAGAESARAQVLAAHAESAAQIEAATIAAIGALDAKHATSLEQVDAKETAGLDDVNTRFAAGREQHEARGPHYAERAVARGQEHAHQYERCKGDYSDDGFWDGCLTVRRAKAQQDAACKTAAGYEEAFLRTANKKAYDLRELRKQYRCAVIDGARQVNQTLDATHDATVSGLTTGRTQALAGIALARDENLSAIDQALAGTLNALAAQEFSQRLSINDTGYLKQLAIEQLAHSAASGLALGVSAAMNSLEQTLLQVREQFAQGGVPAPESLAAAATALGGGMDMLLGTMEEGAGQAEGRIEDLGAASLEALFLITSQNDELSLQVEFDFAQQLDNLTSGAVGAIGQLAGNHVQQAEEATVQGTSSMEQAVAGFDQALATIGGKVDQAIATSLQELNTQLDDKLGELDGQIATEAWKAAEKEQPAWKSVVAIVLVILVIIAAAVISIVTLGAGASLFAIILVGALVGAVSAGLIQIINNWASGQAWHEGLVQAMVIGAIGGALGGGLGFAGGALASGAAAAGARVATQFAINLGADVLAEGLTQTFAYVAFGQDFNWQGFVMAGAMSGVSFRGQPRGGRGGAPRADIPSPAAAGAASGRRAAVAQIAGGAALGMGLEYATAKLSGQEFDPARAASAAASGALGARLSRRGGPSGPTPEPTTRLGRAAQRLRGFDPGGVGARLETRLQGLGGRLAGAAPVERPSVTQPPTADQRPTSRPVEETAPTRPRGDEAAPRPIKEPAVEPARRPVDADAAAELARPANRMNEQDLIDATTTRARVGDSDHEFRISRQGPEICTACDLTKQHLKRMLSNLPEGPLRVQAEALQKLVADVEARLANGESGVKMVKDSATIAAEFRALFNELHPSPKAPLEDPRLRSATESGIEVPKSTHLRELDADVVKTKTIAASDFRSVPMNEGDKAIYVLRDTSTGAVLKVGIAEDNLGRVTQYSNAGNKLGLKLELDVAIVQPRPGKTIRDIEADLRYRLENEGHIMPWDNFPTGRLGRSDRGTPFVHPVGKNLMWDEHGNLVQKGTGRPPPPTRRGMSTPEEVAQFIHDGLSNAEIARIKDVDPSTVSKWKTRWASEISDALDRLKTAEDSTKP